MSLEVPSLAHLLLPKKPRQRGHHIAGAPAGAG
ncbi:hypothetical protein T12_14421, partial [Trichinella patagoniensis]